MKVNRKVIKTKKQPDAKIRVHKKQLDLSFPLELKWLSKSLPRNIFFILSTLPDSEDEKFGFLTKLQSMFTTGTTFLEIKEIPPQDAQKTLERLIY